MISKTIAGKTARLELGKHVRFVPQYAFTRRGAMRERSHSAGKVIGKEGNDQGTVYKSLLVGTWKGN